MLSDLSDLSDRVCDDLGGITHHSGYTVVGGGAPVTGEEKSP